MKNVATIAWLVMLSASCFAEIGYPPEAAEKLNFVWRSRETTANVNRMSSSDYLEYYNPSLLNVLNMQQDLPHIL